MLRDRLTVTEMQLHDVPSCYDIMVMWDLRNVKDVSCSLLVIELRLWLNRLGRKRDDGPTTSLPYLLPLAEHLTKLTFNDSACHTIGRRCITKILVNDKAHSRCFRVTEYSSFKESNNWNSKIRGSGKLLDDRYYYYID